MYNSFIDFILNINRPSIYSDIYKALLWLPSIFLNFQLVLMHHTRVDQRNASKK